MENKYDLVQSHIDYLRMLLRETSDDSFFTDELIYKALLDARSLILERRLQRGKQLSRSMYQTICMPLCIDTYHDCDCIPDLGCEVLKTKYEVPTAFYNGQLDVLRVSTLIGEEISPSTEAVGRYRQYKKTNKRGMYYISVNRRFAIFNRLPNPLKIIKITAIFEDPVAAASIHNCDPDTACYEIQGTGFGVKSMDNVAMYEIAMANLLKTKQIPEDESNNMNSVPKQQSF